MKLFLAFTIPMILVFAQDLKQSEESSLQQAVAEAGTSPVELVHALENHLQKFPNSPRRAEIERALAKTAIDIRDDARTIQYGQLTLARDPDNVALLGSVSTALLRRGDKL